jgi:electron transfer flavoprotein beta subunit
VHLVVCVKHIPDPEAPWAQFRIDEAAKAVVPLPGVRWLASPFDEQAVEAALRLRVSLGEARITALTLGGEPARAVLKHALAMGADDGVLLSDPQLEAGDGHTTATVLAAAIRKLGAPDLVLTGRQAADWDAGVVGCGIAELLDRPVVTFAAEIRVEGANVVVRRVVEDGTDVVEAPLPAVVTVSNELGTARTPNLRETMRAARKPVVAWSAAELGLDPAALAPRRVRERLFEPPKGGRCELIAGDTPEAQAAALAARLVAARLIPQ